MYDTLIEIFKKAVNDDASVKSDVIDYLVDNGGPGPAFAAATEKSVTIELLGNYDLDLPARVYCEIACLLATNKKIPAIKMLRAETGFGLKEVKEAVENYNNWPIRVD